MGDFSEKCSVLVPISLRDDVIDEGAVQEQIIKIPGLAQDQSLFKRIFQMPIRRFDGTVLMCFTTIIAGWLAAIMLTEGCESNGKILLL